jgi:hypothetical protein
MSLSSRLKYLAALMARRRKTKAKREAELSNAELLAWDQFRPKLEALTSLAEAMLLLKSAPPVGFPAFRYYSHFSDFLHDVHTIPADSSFEEKALYLKFIHRLDAAGALKPPGVGQKIQEALRSAMALQGKP